MDDWIKHELRNYIRNHGCQIDSIGDGHQLLVQLVDAEAHLKQVWQKQPSRAGDDVPLANINEWIQVNGGFTVTADLAYLALEANPMENSDAPTFNAAIKVQHTPDTPEAGPIKAYTLDLIMRTQDLQPKAGEVVAAAPVGASCDEYGLGEEVAPVPPQISATGGANVHKFDGHDDQSATPIAQVLNVAIIGIDGDDSHAESEWTALTTSAAATASGAWGDSHGNDSGTGSGSSAWTTPSGAVPDVSDRPYGTEDAVPGGLTVSRTGSQDIAAAAIHPRENADDSGGGGGEGPYGGNTVVTAVSETAKPYVVAVQKRSQSLTTAAGVRGGTPEEKEDREAITLVAFPGSDVQSRLRRCLVGLLWEKPAQLVCFAELGIRLSRHSEAGPLWRDPTHRQPKLREFVEAAAAAAPEALKVTRHAEWNNYGVSLDVAGLRKMALRRAVAAAYPGNDDVSVVRRAAAASLLDIDGPDFAVRFALNMPAMGQAVIQAAAEARQRLVESWGSTAFQLGSVLNERGRGKPSTASSNRQPQLNANRNKNQEYEPGESGDGRSSSSSSNGGGGVGARGYLSVVLPAGPGNKVARLDVTQLLKDAAAGRLGDLTAVQPLPPRSAASGTCAPTTITAAAASPSVSAAAAAAPPPAVPAAISPAEGGTLGGMSRRVRDALRAAIPEHRPEYRAKRALALVAAASRGGAVVGPPPCTADPPYSLRSSPCGLMLADLGLKPPKGQMRALFEEEPDVFKAGRPSPSYLIELLWEPLRQLARTAPEEVAAAAAHLLHGRTYPGIRLRSPSFIAAESETGVPATTTNNNYNNNNTARDNTSFSTQQHPTSSNNHHTAGANTNRAQPPHPQPGFNRYQDYNHRHDTTGGATFTESSVATAIATITRALSGGGGGPRSEPPGLAPGRKAPAATTALPGLRVVPTGQPPDYFVRLERALDERLGAGSSSSGGGGAGHGSVSAATDFLTRARLVVARTLLKRTASRSSRVGAGAVQLPPYTMSVKDVAMVLKRELPEAYQGADRRPPGTFPVNAVVLAQQLPLLFSVDNSGPSRDWTIRLNVNSLELSAGLTPTAQTPPAGKAKATEPARQHQQPQQSERAWSLDEEGGTWSLDQEGATWALDTTGGNAYGGEDAESAEEPYEVDEDGGSEGGGHGVKDAEAEADAAAAAAAAVSHNATMTAAAVAEVLATQPARALAAALAPTIPPDLLPDPVVHVIAMPYSAAHVTALAHCLSCPQIGLAAKCVGGVPALVLLYAPAVDSLKPAAATAAAAVAATATSPAGVLPATVYLLDAAAARPTEGAVLLASLRGLMEEPGVAKVVHGCEQLVPGLELAVGCPISPLLDTRLVSEMLKPLDLSTQQHLSRSTGGAEGSGGGSGSGEEVPRPDDGSTAPQLWPLPSHWQAALNTKYWDYHLAALQHASGADSSWLPRPFTASQLGLAVRAVQHLPELWSALTWLLPRLAQFCSVARAQQCRALLGAPPAGAAW